MFQNLTKVANSIGQMAEVLSVNIDSLNNLSLAGNEKSKLVLKASEYDVAEQQLKLNAKIEAMQAKIKSKPKS